ncbi:hypothetical protein Bbelb_412410 [Branchiostoma belcheri]|nr:hypothetical protein Bbelb_412410 [Branchiostoma belcheri]
MREAVRHGTTTRGAKYWKYQINPSTSDIHAEKFERVARRDQRVTFADARTHTTGKGPWNPSKTREIWTGKTRASVPEEVVKCCFTTPMTTTRLERKMRERLKLVGRSIDSVRGRPAWCVVAVQRQDMTNMTENMDTPGSTSSGTVRDVISYVYKVLQAISMGENDAAGATILLQHLQNTTNCRTSTPRGLVMSTQLVTSWQFLFNLWTKKGTRINSDAFAILEKRFRKDELLHVAGGRPDPPGKENGRNERIFTFHVHQPLSAEHVLRCAENIYTTENTTGRVICMQMKFPLTDVVYKTELIRTQWLSVISIIDMLAAESEPALPSFQSKLPHRGVSIQTLKIAPSSIVWSSRAFPSNGCHIGVQAMPPMVMLPTHKYRISSPNPWLGCSGKSS